MEQKEFWRKALLFGFGVWDFTKQKVEALVEEMVKRGEISQQESPEAVEQIMAKAKETNQALFAKVKELTSKALSEMKVAHANDLEALEKRVAALEKELVEREIEGREGSIVD
jgi:polyhydroxyalkanoate synthesis regulator phasin